MKKKIVDIPIYGGKLIIREVKNWKKINKKYNFELEPHVDGCVFNMISDSKDHSEFHICFLGKPSNSLIVHEVIHLVNSIYKYRHVELDLDNDEPQAYLAEWLFEQVEQYFEENGKYKK